MRKIVFLFILICYSFSYAKPYKDEVIVFFKNKIQTQTITGLSIIKTHNNMAVVKLTKNKDMDTYIKELTSRQDVVYAIPNYIITKQIIPNDTYYPYQWYLRKINMENAWNISTGSNNVYVAVLDSGIDYNHEDIKDNIWLNTGELLGKDDNHNGIDDGCENDIDDDNNGYIDDCYGFNAVAGKGSALDDDGHGTFVSGEIGAIGNNAKGVAGINWNIKIIPCKFLSSDGSGDLNQLLQCLNYIKTIKETKGIDIVAINGSYGYTGDKTQLNIDCSNPSYQNTEKCLIQSIGALFSVAAGNYGQNNDKTVFLPCNYSTVLNNVICVGSTNSNDEKSSFSNYGTKTVNIYAPGGEITTSSTCDKTQEIIGLLNNNKYGCAVGTSQAAPLVAGLAALLKASNPNLTISDIKNRIILTGDNLMSLSGYGITANRINAYNALLNTPSPKITIDKHINQDSFGNYYYDYGSVQSGQPLTLSFNIKNSGNAVLNIGKLSISNTKNFSIIQDNCSNKNLNSFEECGIQIQISPCGDNETILSIPTNTSYGNLNIKLTGNTQINCTSQAPSSNSGGGGGGCNLGGSANLGISLLILVIIITGRRLVRKLA